MSEPVRVKDVTEEMNQFNAAMETLGGFLNMMNPRRSAKISISRCRFYGRIFEECMKQLDIEAAIPDPSGGGR